MTSLLLLETSAKNCSVAILSNQGLVSQRMASAEHFIHAEQLHQMLSESITESDLNWRQISGICVSKGPGSYTGLRIGISAAKGLCFALGIPLMAVDTTQLLASHAASIHKDAQRIIPMIDARRMEVYMAEFDGKANRLSADEAVIIDESMFSKFNPEALVLIGDGVAKCSHLLDNRIRTLCTLPTAEMMCELALQRYEAQQFEDTAYFEPFYLKEYTPGISRKSVL
jgi:tRNA threonylcarbamoyladenosine biosynthesis protein TsaB